MRFLLRSMVGVFLLAVTVGLLAFAGQTVRGAVQERMSQEDRQRPARERVFAVNVVAFQPATIQPTLETFGEVRSRRTLEVRATAGGTIVELSGAFQEGGQVKAGDLLLRIDDADAQAALDVAMADMKEAKAEEIEADKALVLALEELDSAVEQADLRGQALTRAQELFERRIGSEAAVENAELAEASARQAVLSRKQAVAQAEARIDQAATSLSRREIALADAQRRLDETKLFAEFSGTLSDVSVVKGGLVQNNERLADLVDPNDLEVSFRVSTNEYSRLLQNGSLGEADVQVGLDVFGSDLMAKGKISRESATVGEGQTGRALFAQLSNPVGLRPGDFVSVNVAEPELPFVVSLPAAAVAADATVLFLGDEDRLELAKVNVLRRQGDEVLVRSRDLLGKEVVAERTPLLGTGIKVRPLRAGDNTSAPEEPEMVELSEERRAKLVAFIEGNKRMPAEAKKRVLGQLSKPKVPAQMVARIESRMGG